MAEMIPESISAHPNVTPGEKRLFKLLQEALQPDEDFLVWYEPRAIDRYPDFIVWGQYLGLLVIEGDELQDFQDNRQRQDGATLESG